MRPVSFNGCFGWLHEGSTSTGAVICNALGGDEITEHRSVHELAQALASRGITTLRFDYPGSGDSLDLIGSHTCNVAAWCHSVADAAKWLRKATDVQSLTLIGSRFGGTLATLAGAELNDIEALVLIWPVVSGRLYSRELTVKASLERALEAADIGEQQRKRTSAGVAVDAGGFRYPNDFLLELQGINLATISTRPARRILLYNREIDRFSNEPFSKRLRELGSDVEIDVCSPLVDDAATAEIGQATVANWISKSAPKEPVTQLSQHTSDAILTGVGFREAATTFGHRGHLTGVLCQPEAWAGNGPTAVFLTSWPASRIGHGRMWVSIARNLAKAGICSFRFDIAEVGDSASRPDRHDTEHHPELAADDVESALSWLSANGYSEPVLIGFCWGAALAASVSRRKPSLMAGQLLIYFPIEFEVAANQFAMARKHIATISSTYWWTDYASFGDFLKIIWWTIMRIKRILTLWAQGTFRHFKQRRKAPSWLDRIKETLKFSTKTLLIYCEKDDFVKAILPELKNSPVENVTTVVLASATRGDRLFLHEYRPELSRAITEYLETITSKNGGRAECVPDQPIH
jgi:pimeloyl-ACP methyl ester carboxylesterase